MDTTLRLDQIRRILARDCVTTTQLAEAVKQLCDRSSHAAIDLRFDAMQKLHKVLRIDNHRLLRKQPRSLRHEDIPANAHLAILRRVTELVLDETESKRADTQKRAGAVLARLEEQKRRHRQLEADLADYIDALTEEKVGAVWTNSASLNNVKREFIAQVTNLAKARWPKNAELVSVSNRISDLQVQLASADGHEQGQTLAPEQLRKRLTLIQRLSSASKEARKKLRSQRIEKKERKAQLLANTARRAQLDRQQEEQRKAALDHLQNDLDRENQLIQETAKRLINHSALPDVIADLKSRGISDPMRIAKQATIYARNVILAHDPHDV